MVRGLTICKRHWSELRQLANDAGEPDLMNWADRTLVQGPQAFCPFCVVENSRGASFVRRDMADFIGTLPPKAQRRVQVH